MYSAKLDSPKSASHKTLSTELGTFFKHKTPMFCVNQGIKRNKNIATVTRNPFKGKEDSDKTDAFLLKHCFPISAKPYKKQKLTNKRIAFIIIGSVVDESFSLRKMGRIIVLRIESIFTFSQAQDKFRPLYNFNLQAQFSRLTLRQTDVIDLTFCERYCKVLSSLE